MLLIIFTIILLYILISQNSSFVEDESYPKPIVILEIHCKNGETVRILDEEIIEDCIDDNLRVDVILLNNSSEPSRRRYELACGVLLVFRGAKLLEYDIKDFQFIIGVSENSEIIEPLNSSIVEIYSNEIGGLGVKRANLIIKLDPEVEKVEIFFRGWIVDEDKKVFNPVDREEEFYVARYPPENITDNPPDTRWAGREFLRYKMFRLEVWK